MLTCKFSCANIYNNNWSQSTVIPMLISHVACWLNLQIMEIEWKHTQLLRELLKTSQWIKKYYCMNFGLLRIRKWTMLFCCHQNTGFCSLPHQTGIGSGVRHKVADTTQHGVLLVLLLKSSMWNKFYDWFYFFKLAGSLKNAKRVKISK